MTQFPLSDDVLSRLARAQRVSNGELEALKLALKQRKSKDIAKQLGISEAATRKRLGEVYKKFGIKGKGPGKLGSLEQHLIAQAHQSSQISTEQLTTRSITEWPITERAITEDFDALETEQAMPPLGQSLDPSANNQSAHNLFESSQSASGQSASGQPKNDQLGSGPHLASKQLPPNPGFKTQYCWRDAPTTALNHIRREPLSLLKHWILQPAEQSKLLAICGLGGVGKSAIALTLAEELNGYFEQVVWLTAEPQQSPNEFLKRLLEILSSQKVAQANDAKNTTQASTTQASTAQVQNTPQTTRGLIHQVISWLSGQRCLIILDGYESVFSHSDAVTRTRERTPTFDANRQQQASLYPENLGGYGVLLKALQASKASVPAAGASCLILTSREKPKELLNASMSDSSSLLYVLKGFKIHEVARLLSLFELKGESADFRELLERYHGHPMALQLAASTIKAVFSGHISAFLAQEISVFDELRTVLNEQFSRLSFLEAEALYWLAINHVPCTLEDLQADIVAEDHKTNLLYTLRSLERRFLIEVANPNRIFNQASYQLHPLVSEYVLGLFVRRMFKNLMTGDLSFFNRYALMKADAEESCRTFQKVAIVQPILKRLRNHLKSLFQVDKWLNNKLDSFRKDNPYRLGYAGGNFVNLMVVLSEGKLSHKNFSELTIWQAYLQGAELRAVNFNRCELNRSVFTDTLSDVMALSLNQPSQQSINQPLQFSQNKAAAEHRTEHRTAAKTMPLLACGDTNGTVHVWRSQGLSIDAGQKFAEWSAHNGWVRSLSFIPNQNCLITGGDDSRLKLWQLPVGESSDSVTQVKLLWQKKTTDWVRAIAISPNGKIVASGSKNNITLRQVNNGKRICQLWHQPALEVEQADTDASSETNTQAHTARSASKHRRKAHPKGLSLAFSPNNQWLASCGSDDTIRLWSVDQLITGASKGASKIESSMELVGHKDWVREMQFSPDSKMLISGGYDGTIRIWSTETGKCKSLLSQSGGLVQAIALSPKGKLLASGSDNGQVKLWDLHTYRLLKTISTKESRVSTLGFQQQGDSLFLAAGGDKQTLKLWQVHSVSNPEQDLRQNPEQPHSSRSYSPQSHSSGQLSKRIAVRPVRTYRGYTNGIRAVSFLGTQHVMSGGDSRELSVWDSVSGEHKANLSLHQGRIWAIALDKRNARIASASDDHTIRLWDANTGQCLTTFAEHTSWVRTVDFSRRGRLLASGGDDATLRIWNTTSGFCVKTLSCGYHWIHSVAFDPTNSRYLASGGDEAIVRYWRRKEDVSSPMAHHEHRVCAVVFSPDGALVASGSDDSTVMVWDVGQNELLYHFKDSELAIKTVTFSPDGRYLAAAGEDQIVYLWDLRSPDQKAPHKTCRKLRPQSLTGLAGGIRSLAFSPDGTSLISGGLDATIRIADLTLLEQNKTPTLTPLIQPDRPYENIEIEGVRGLSHLQMSNLLSLGAVNRKTSLFQ